MSTLLLEITVMYTRVSWQTHFQFHIFTLFLRRFFCSYFPLNQRKLCRDLVRTKLALSNYHWLNCAHSFTNIHCSPMANVQQAGFVKNKAYFIENKVGSLNKVILGWAHAAAACVSYEYHSCESSNPPPILLPPILLLFLAAKHDTIISHWTNFKSTAI